MAGQPLKIGVFGITGRMGRSLIEVAQTIPDITIVAGTASPNNATLTLQEVLVTPDTALVIDKSDVLIDFSNADAALKHIQLCNKANKPLVMCVTGFTPEVEVSLKAKALKSPILYAANTSIGITILSHLVKQAAKMLDHSFDIEIFEAHHRQKLDAPSGTALILGKAAALGRNTEVNTPLIRANGKRQADEIGYAIQRGGGIVGDHSVRFISDEEIVELSHRSLSRNLFARGALKAAVWLQHQPGGQLYSMQDCLS